MTLRRWYDEVYNDEVRFGLKVERTLYDATSPFQRITIVETTAYGRALLLDDVWMASELDEHYYHEMIVHPAMTTAPRIGRVLVIGAGDGGTVREVLRHPEVTSVVMVEIDEMVVEACKVHLPTIGTAWGDPRLTLKFEDAISFVRRLARQAADPQNRFDVIIVDGSDPVGPAEGLFGEPFYRDCASLLDDDGVFITQSESPVVYRETHLRTVRLLESIFGFATPYYSAVPIYCGGEWSWTYASRRTRPDAIIAPRARRVEAHTRMYNLEYHLGALALPNAIKRELGR